MIISTSNKVYEKPKFYSRHHFSSAIKRQITELHKLDNWHGIAQILEDWFWIGISISCSIMLWHILNSVLAFLFYCCTVIVIGARQRGLRVNNHQATHKALAKNKLLNFFLGTVCASWLALESFTGYNDSHNSRANGHHVNLGTAHDVDHMAVVKTGLYKSGVTKDDVHHYLLSIPLQTPKYLKFLLFNRILNPHENLWERAIRLVYFIAIASVLIYFGYGIEFALYWLIPLLTTANWIGSFIQLAEHYPLIATAEQVDIYLSRNRILSPVLNFFVGTHQEGYHLIHHLYPKLPFWNMKKAHQILMADPVYASIHKERGLNNLMKALTES